MIRTVLLAGSYDMDVTVPCTVVGSLAVHRPAFQYMRGQPVTVCKTGWAVSHVATGMRVCSAMAKGPRGESLLTTRKAAVQWAERVQASDPEAWAAADALPFNGGMQDMTLGRRLLDSVRNTAP